MLIRSGKGVPHAVEGNVTITGKHDQQAVEGGFEFPHQAGERVTPAALHLVNQAEFPHSACVNRIPSPSYLTGITW